MGRQKPQAGSGLAPGSASGSANQPPTPHGSATDGGSSSALGGSGSRFSLEMAEPRKGRMETWIVLELCDLGSLQVGETYVV